MNNAKWLMQNEQCEINNLIVLLIFIEKRTII